MPTEFEELAGQPEFIAKKPWEKLPEGYKKVWYQESVKDPDKIYYYPTATAKYPRLRNTQEFSWAKSRQYYWDSPQRVARFYNLIRTQSDNWQPPPWLDTDSINQLYKYLEFRNGSSDWTNWKRLPEDDPGFALVAGMEAPPQQFLFKNEQDPTWRFYEELRKREEQEGIEYGSWNDLEPWEQMMSTLGGGPQPYKDRPEWSRVVSAGIKGVGAGVGGYALGSVGAGLSTALISAATGTAIFPGVGTAVGLITGLTVAALTSYQLYTGKEIPVLGDILGVFNILSQGTENVIGTGQQIFEADDFAEIVPYLKEAWQASSLKYDVSKEGSILGTGDWLADAVSVAAHKINPEWSSGLTTDAGHVWQFQKGITGPQMLRGGVMNGEALTEARERLIAGEDVEMVYADMIDRFGYGGMMSDFINQTILDPMQYMPWMINRLGAKVSKGIGTKALAAGDFPKAKQGFRLWSAFDATKGNIIIDGLPVGFQQLADHFGRPHGIHSTGGILSTFGLYKRMIQTGHMPVNVPDIPDVVHLTDFEMRIGGIDPETGMIKTLMPADPNKTGIAKTYDWLTNLKPDAKAFAIMENMTNNANNFYYLAKGDPVMFTNMIYKAAGVDSQGVGNIGKNLFDSPLMATLSVANKKFVDSGVPQNMLADWTSSSGNRAILYNMANAIGETPGRLVELSASDPGYVLKKLRAAAINSPDQVGRSILASIENNSLTEGDIKKLFGAYNGKDSIPFTSEEYAATMMMEMSNSTDAFLVDYLGIKPSNVVFRVSKLLKSATSFVLLGLNPAYAKNNMVNNPITRAASGIGGYMTPNQISGFWTKMGVAQPARYHTGFGASTDISGVHAGTAIFEAVNPKDMITAMGKWSRKLNKMGIFSNLSNKVEVAESGQAITIAAQQMMGQQWKYGKGISTMPADLKAELGADLSKQVIRALESDIDMNAIKKIIFEEGTFSLATESIDSAILKLFPDPEIGHDLLVKMGVSEYLTEHLKGATPDQARQVIADAKKIIRDQIDLHRGPDYADRLHDVGNRVATEGAPAAFDLWEEMYNKIFSRRTKDTFDMSDAIKRADDLRAKGDYAGASRVWNTVEAQSALNWLETRNYILATIKGTTDGMGIDNPLTRKYFNTTFEQMQAWDTFYNEKWGNLRSYYNTEYATSALRKDAWNNVQKLNNDLYTKHAKIELDFQATLDDTFSRMFEPDPSKPNQAAIEWRKKVAEVRAEQVGELTSLRHKIENSDMTPAEQRAVYAEYLDKISRPLIVKKRDVSVAGAQEFFGQKPTNGASEVETPLDSLKSKVYKAQVEAEYAKVAHTADQTTDAVLSKMEFKYNLKIGEARTNAIMGLLEAHANAWAKRHNATSNDWYAQHLSGIKSVEDVNNLDAIDLYTKSYEGDSLVKGKINLESDSKAILKAFDSATIKTLVKRLWSFLQRDIKITDQDAFVKYLKGGEATPEYRRGGEWIYKVYENVGETNQKIVDTLKKLQPAEAPVTKAKVTPTLEALKSQVAGANRNKLIDIARKTIALEQTEEVVAFVKILDGLIELEDSAPMKVEGTAPVAGTPTLQFMSDILSEIESGTLGVLFDQILDDYINSTGESFKLGEIPEGTRAKLDQYMKQVDADLASTKQLALSYGEMKRDESLLNYSARYGIDDVLEVAFPYQFWFTRSLGEWAKRMIGQPSVAGTYARYKRMQNKMRYKGIPSRFEGKLRIPTPWLPDWMGNSVYIDPLKLLYPPDQMFQPLVQLGKEGDEIYSQAERNVTALLKQGLITQAQANEALENHTGVVWEQAVALAQDTYMDEGFSATSMASMMMTPGLWWTVPAYIAEGKPEKISPLPATRLGQALRGQSEGILGFIGSILAAPEETVRKKAGLSYYGEWGDYYVDRMLSNMAGDGAISTDDALRAMIERKGETYDLAIQRVERELSLKMPGSILTETIKDGDLMSIPFAMMLTVFPAGLFPEGEMKQRGLKEQYDQAWQDLHNGKSDAIEAFFDENPEYKARLALWDEPEERLRQFLVSEIWDKYTQLADANKPLLAEQLGTQFQRSFLDKGTRDYTSIDIETLGMWARILGSNVPQTPETHFEGQLPEIEQYKPDIAASAQQFIDYRKQAFPDYFWQQNVYYKLPQGQRASFLNKFPELASYWDWKKAYMRSNPAVAAWNEDKKRRAMSITEKGVTMPEEINTDFFKQFDPALMQELLLFVYLNQPLTAGAKAELTRIWDDLGRPGDDLELWINAFLGK